MLWTTLLLTRHSFRLWQVRILLFSFLVLLLIWSLPDLSRAGALQSAADPASFAWPRFLGYAWLLVEARRGDARLGLRFELHPMARGPGTSLLSWYTYRCLVEIFALWACGEVLLRITEPLMGYGFHVEPMALLCNALVLSSIFLLSHSLRILFSAMRIALPLVIGLIVLSELLAQTATRREDLLELAVGLFLLALASVFSSLTREHKLC